MTVIPSFVSLFFWYSDNLPNSNIFCSSNNPEVTNENIKSFKYEELFGKKRFEAIFSND